MTETEHYLRYKFESLAKQDFASIPVREIKLVNEELSKYLASRESAKTQPDSSLSIPGLFAADHVSDDEKVDARHDESNSPDPSLGQVIVNRTTKANPFRSTERKVLHAFLCDNVNRLGQVIDVSPEILGLTHFNRRAFISACCHVSGSLYNETFPNARLSYRRIDGMDGTHFVITVLAK